MVRVPRMFGWSLLPAVVLLSGSFSCAVPRRSLTIVLEETPLYPEKQWAIVNMSYIKVNKNLGNSQTDGLLGMVRFGNIIEVVRIEKSPEDNTIWAYIVWQSAIVSDTEASGTIAPNIAEPKVSEAAGSVPGKTIRGWVPYGFLHIVGNLKEARLANRRMLMLEGITVGTERVSPTGYLLPEPSSSYPN
ncbi:hypothetical protein P0082_04495 [Candidatus Haliotispira prima]|uniref:Uncharacterized protein n=1 Tax=Candidatus Haliotispira prima TaxID=3034016 RepID=A0ABY8ML75_9SPIO|nr:hypothetical protein P0082_04495 [Candidatus Haliotispira prima]